MYEQFFSLARRPFAPTPTAEAFVPTRTAVEAVDGLVTAVADGGAIVLLTAPGGLGKTVVCQKAISSLTEAFLPVLVASGSFATRRALLQACLFELGAPYSRLPEDELRLGLLERLRQIGGEGKTAVLVIDEAHLVEPEVLDELRVVAEAQQEGRRLATVVLAGQLELEERLADPRLDAVNQRVHRHLMLESLGREESKSYVADRVEWAGGDAEVCFDEEAFDLIVRTADGSPRALNQLCDQTLLLAHVDERRPADVEMVLEAYENLKHLPLHWNAPLDDEPDATLTEAPDASSLGEPEPVVFEPAEEPFEEPAAVLEIGEPSSTTESELDCQTTSEPAAAESTECDAVVFEVGWTDDSNEESAVSVTESPSCVEAPAPTDEQARIDASPVDEPRATRDALSPEARLPAALDSFGTKSPFGKFDETVEWQEEPLPVGGRRLRGLPVDPTAVETVADEVEIDEAPVEPVAEIEPAAAIEPVAEVELPESAETVVRPEAADAALVDVVLPELEQILTGPAATFEIGGEPEPDEEEAPEVESVDATMVEAAVPKPEEPEVEELAATAAEPPAAAEPAASIEPETTIEPEVATEIDAVERQLERDVVEIARETQRLLRSDSGRSDDQRPARSKSFDVVEPERVRQPRAAEADSPADPPRARGRRPRRFARLFSELRREHGESRR